MGVTSIAERTFSGCSKLTSIVVNKNNSVYYSEGNCIVHKKSKTLIVGCNTGVIPNGVTGIGAYAFSGCAGLTSIVIPDSVTSIDSYAFFDCSGLTSVTLGKGVTSIGSCAFSDCSGLTSIVIPNSVTIIRSYVFDDCIHMKAILCKASSRPTGWNYSWNSGCSAEVVWNFSECTTHKWVDATCTAPKTCSTCYLPSGTALEHKWVDATCTTPKTCSRCNITDGPTLHAFQKEPCPICGYFSQVTSEKIENIKNSKELLYGLKWYNVNVVTDKEGIYNYDKLTDATAGPVEIWNDNLQLLPMLNSYEIDVAVGFTYLDLYYRPEGSDIYELASLQAWSSCPIGDNTIYRCHFYDEMYHNLSVGTTYEVVLAIREGDTVVAWADSYFTWTDSCASYVHYAENNTKIIK